jgi:hypothetical protein
MLKFFKEAWYENDTDERLTYRHMLFWVTPKGNVYPIIMFPKRKEKIDG